MSLRSLAFFKSEASLTPNLSENTEMDSNADMTDSRVRILNHFTVLLPQPISSSQRKQVVKTLFRETCCPNVTDSCS